MTPRNSFGLNKNLALKILTGFATIAFAASAFADGIIERGSWTLWEEQSANGTICYMQAIDSQAFRKEDFLLEIHHAKNNYDSPIEVFTKINKNKNNNKALRIDLKAGSQLGFIDISGKRERFWAVPKNLSSLIAQLQSGESISGKAYGGSKEFDISFGGNGFAEVYATFEKHCNNGYALLEPRFEQEFLASMPNSIDPTNLSSDQALTLRTAYYAAFALHRQGLGAEAQLEAVLSKYRAFLDEQKANRDEKQQILSIDLPQSQKTLAEAQMSQIELKLEIDRLNGQIPSLSDQVQRSAQILEQARAVLAPLLPEFNRLTNLVRTNEDALRSAQNRLRFIDSRLNELNRTISNLQNEADQVERHLRQLRQDYDRAIANLRDAEFRRSQFDVRREIERRLQQNGEYTRIKSERDRIDPEMAKIRSQITQIEQERARILRDLDTCRKDTSRDCSQYEQGLVRADQMINENRARLRQLESRRSELDRAMMNIENSVQNDVRREYDNLVNNENRARQDVNRIDDGIRSDQSRLNSIRNNEIPRLTDEQRSLNNERPSLLAQISDRERQLNQARQDLERFKSVNDFDRKSNDVNRKELKLSQDQAALDQVLRAKAYSEQRLQEAISTESQMTKRISELNARVASLDAREVELEKLLKNLPAERAPIDAKIANLKRNINIKRDEMLKILRG
jgi:predicted  nucleic acid-binding Zn-ribbon protein